MTKKFSEDHEWVSVEGDIATIGITAYATEQLGDIVYVELPDTGRSIAIKDEVCVVESVKAASEVYAPISGEITDVNDALGDNPSLVNEAAETDGWFFKVKVSNAGELDALMDETAYAEFVKGLG